MNVPFVAWASGGGAAAGTWYLPAFGAGSVSGNWTGNEYLVRAKIRATGVLSNLTVFISSNTGNSGTHTLRVRKNDLNGNGVISITAQTGLVEDAVNTDSFAAGNWIALQVTLVASTTFNLQSPSLLWASTTGTFVPFTSLLMNFNGTVADQFWHLLSDRNAFSATEALMQVNIPCVSTLRNLHANVDMNTRTGGNDSVRLRINGVNTNLTFTVVNGVTSELEDVTNSDSVAVGDLVNYRWVNGGTAGRAILRGIRTELAATDRFVMMGARNGGGNNDVDHYIPLYGYAGRYSSPMDTEAWQQCRTDVAFTWSNLWGYSDSIAGTVAIRSRINGVNGNQVITWTASSGEREDTSGTDAVAVDDLINYFNDSTAGSGIVRSMSSLGSAIITGGPRVFGGAVAGHRRNRLAA